MFPFFEQHEATWLLVLALNSSEWAFIHQTSNWVVLEAQIVLLCYLWSSDDLLLLFIRMLFLGGGFPFLKLQQKINKASPNSSAAISLHLPVLMGVSPGWVLTVFSCLSVSLWRLFRVSSAVGRMRHSGSGRLALGNPGKLCHPVIIPSLPVGSQLAHRGGHCHHGDRLFGLRGRRQREPPPAAHGKSDARRRHLAVVCTAHNTTNISRSVTLWVSCPLDH